MKTLKFQIPLFRWLKLAAIGHAASVNQLQSHLQTVMMSVSGGHIMFQATDAFLAAERGYGLTKTDWHPDFRARRGEALVPAETILQAATTFKKMSGKDIDLFDVHTTLYVGPEKAGHIDVGLERATLFGGTLVEFHSELVKTDKYPNLAQLLEPDPEGEGDWPKYYGVQADTIMRLAKTIGSNDALIRFKPRQVGGDRARFLFDSPGAVGWRAAAMMKVREDDE